MRISLKMVFIFCVMGTIYNKFVSNVSVLFQFSNHGFPTLSSRVSSMTCCKTGRGFAGAKRPASAVWGVW